MSTQTTTDLAARFEAKREECVRLAQEAFNQGGPVERHLRGQASAFAEASDMARADAARGAETGWQPIETAPTDGTQVDVWDGESRRVSCRFRDGRWTQFIGFRDRRGDVPSYVSGFAPTYWRLPPPPPAQQGSSSPLREGETVGELERLSKAAAKLIAQWDGAPALPEVMEQALSEFEDAWAWADEALASLATARDGGTGADLDDRLRAAGMFTIPEMMGETPLTRWEVHSGMTDLKFFGEWLDRKVVEYMRMRVDYEIGEKDKTDDLYEWVLAHSAAFATIRTNFRAAFAALSATDQAGEVRE
jgi:hypothetical protein